jgi:HD domain
MRERIRQFRQANLPATASDFALGREHLHGPLLALFEGLSAYEVRHGAATARWLLGRGHGEPDLLAAALLHDVAKGAQRRGDRVLWVVAAGAGVSRWLADAGSRFEGRRAMARIAAHSKAGGELLLEAGASPTVVRLTELHHEPGRVDGMLALLQQADAAS